MLAPSGAPPDSWRMRLDTRARTEETQEVAFRQSYSIWGLMVSTSIPDRALTLSLVFVSVLAWGCETTVTTPAQPQSPNMLTHGAVQLKLQKGVTTQTEVIEVFGAPNITTIDGDGREVWTYRRHATVTSSSGSTAYFNVVVFGTQAAGAQASQSTQSMTLVIKFGPDKRVSDFQSMASSF